LPDIPGTRARGDCGRTCTKIVALKGTVMEDTTELATVRGLAQFLGQDALFSRHVLSGRGGLRRDLRGYYIV
jgi:hypothetical protein